MKNIDQIKKLIVECCQNSLEIQITVYDELGYKYWWYRINTADNNETVIETACIYPDYHIAFNLSPTDTSFTGTDTSIKIYSLVGLKIQTSFKNNSSTLSVNVNNYDYEDEEY